MMRRFGSPPAGGGGGGSLTAYDVLLISKSPWGYWKLNETSTPTSGTIGDYSGNGRDGQFHTTGSWAPAAALFGGNDGSVAFSGMGAKAPSTTILATTKVSVVAWIKTTSTATISILSSDSSAAVHRLWQFRMAAGKLQFVSIASSLVVAGTASINDGNPHLVSFIYDPSVSNADGKLKLYIDGLLAVKTAGAISTSGGTTFPGIGARSSNIEINKEGFQGSISNAALFIDAALSAADIADLWAARGS